MQRVKTQTDTITTEVAPGVIMIEEMIGNTFKGARATIDADHFPAPVEVHVDATHSTMLRLKAPWQLPGKLSHQNFSNIALLQKAVASKLNAKALKDYDFPDAEEVEMFPTKERERPINSNAPHLTTYERDGLTVREIYSDTNTTAEFSAADLPGVIVATKGRTEHFFSIGAEFKLPAELMSNFTGVPAIEETIQYCRSHELF